MDNRTFFLSHLCVSLFLNFPSAEEYGSIMVNTFCKDRQTSPFTASFGPSLTINTFCNDRQISPYTAYAGQSFSINIFCTDRQTDRYWPSLSINTFCNDRQTDITPHCISQAVPQQGRRWGSSENSSSEIFVGFSTLVVGG